jgi:hypothetical protein
LYRVRVDPGVSDLERVFAFGTGDSPSAYGRRSFGDTEQLCDSWRSGLEGDVGRTVGGPVLAVRGRERVAADRFAHTSDGAGCARDLGASVNPSAGHWVLDDGACSAHSADQALTFEDAYCVGDDGPVGVVLDGEVFLANLRVGSFL